MTIIGVDPKSDGIAGRMKELVLDNVARFANGEPLRNVVDKEEGY
jgi:hypothetical protein